MWGKVRKIRGFHALKAVHLLRLRKEQRGQGISLRTCSRSRHAHGMRGSPPLNAAGFKRAGCKIKRAMHCSLGQEANPNARQRRPGGSGKPCRSAAAGREVPTVAARRCSLSHTLLPAP